MQLGREPPRPLATAPQRLPSMRTKMDRNRAWIEERREIATKRSTRSRSVKEKESWFPHPLSFLVFATGRERISTRDSCTASTDFLLWFVVPVFRRLVHARKRHDLFGADKFVPEQMEKWTVRDVGREPIMINERGRRAFRGANGSRSSLKSWPSIVMSSCFTKLSFYIVHR